MRVLLDECIPRRIKRELSGHIVLTVPDVGWASIKNGRLLRLAENVFDVFITVDRGMRYQQDLSIFKIAVIVLVVQQNKFKAIQPLLPAIIEKLNKIQVGDVIYIGAAQPST